MVQEKYLVLKFTTIPLQWMISYMDSGFAKFSTKVFKLLLKSQAVVALTNVGLFLFSLFQSWILWGDAVAKSFARGVESLIHYRVLEILVCFSSMILPNHLHPFLPTQILVQWEHGLNTIIIINLFTLVGSYIVINLSFSLTWLACSIN